ncbi:hypothetical protein [Ferruginivarius sediminum]|nr:hypothetical protein [Ferruginivarius sediminum]
MAYEKHPKPGAGDKDPKGTGASKGTSGDGGKPSEEAPASADTSPAKSASPTGKPGSGADTVRDEGKTGARPGDKGSGGGSNNEGPPPDRPSSGYGGHKSMAEPIVFIDIKENEERARLSLQQRLEGLEKRAKDSVLSLSERHELDELKKTADALKKARRQTPVVVDPLYKALQEDLRPYLNTGGQDPAIGPHLEGMLPSQYKDGGNPGYAGLTFRERAFAAVYGVLQRDGLSNPEHSRFKSEVSVALAEYNNDAELYDAVLKTLVEDPDVTSRPEALTKRWVIIAQNLSKSGVQADDDKLPIYIRSGIEDVVSPGTDDTPGFATEIMLPDLEAGTVVEIKANNLRAAQAIFFASMMEEAGLWAVRDKIAELFQYGYLPFTRGFAGDYLYNVVLRKVAVRISEEERRTLYARLFGVPGGNPMMNGGGYREFYDHLDLAASSVVTLLRDLNKSENLIFINQERARKSLRDLAAGLSLHAYGVAYFAAVELQKEINDISRFLGDPEVQRMYGANDMWQVIDQVKIAELNMRSNTTRAKTVANAVAVIIRWCAKNAGALASSSVIRIIDIEELRNPRMSRPVEALSDPTDYDLAVACEQYLAMTSQGEQTIQRLGTNPVEANIPSSQPVRIPQVARDALESVGIPFGRRS